MRGEEKVKKRELGWKGSYANFGVPNDNVEAGLDTLGGTGGQEDVIRVGRESITLLDELGNIFPNVGHSLGVRVGPDAPDGIAQGGGAADGVGRKELGHLLPVGGIEQGGNLQQGAHLLEKEEVGI